MGPLVEATGISKSLIEAGNNLLKPPSSTDAILSLLDEIESLLTSVEQDPAEAVQYALIPAMQALISADLLRNPDSDVRVSVVSCLTEIMRITAPDAPYKDGEMKDIFQVTIEAFGKLADTSCRSYKKAEAVLDTVSRVRSSLVMLDLECDDLILEMFRQFLKLISPDHSQVVLLAMETIMITVIDESEEVSKDLVNILLASVKKNCQGVSLMASRLVEKVLNTCASKLNLCIMDALKSTETTLDMYSPVVSSICQSESATTQSRNVVHAKENEADETELEEQVVPSDSLEDKLDLGLSRKGNRSKRTARGGSRQADGDEKLGNENDLKQLLKQGHSESTDAETDSGSSRKRGRKPNSLMNPEEGYSFKTSSTKKVQEKELGDSSLGKLAAKNASLPAKVGQTNQSVVVSLASPSRTGSRKRSRSKMEETNQDVGSFATPASKKQTMKQDHPEEEDLMESSFEKPVDDIKTVKSSKKEKASKKQIVKTDYPEEEEDLMESSIEKSGDGNKTSKSSKKGRARTSAKKPLAETKMVKTIEKKTVHSDAKKKKSEGASMDTPIPQSSKSKKKNSRATTTPSTKESEQTPKESSKSKKKNPRATTTPLTKESEKTPKSHPKRKRTAVEEVVSDKNELGKELVGKRVKVWWPMDENFYEGVITSYIGSRKKHRVLYSDGESEVLILKNERWEIIQDNSTASENLKQDKEIDLPESITLSDFYKRQKAKKRKNVSTNVELSSSPEARSSTRTMKKKDSVPKSAKQVKRTKGALTTVSNDQPESKEDKNLRSMKELNGEHGRTRSRTEKRQKATRAVQGESEKDCDEKEEPEAKGEESKKDQQEVPEDPSAETETDGEELKSTKEQSSEPEAGGEERNPVKESIVEPKTDGEEQEAAKEPNGEPKTDGEEHKVAKEPTAEPKTDGEEQKPVKETNAELETSKEERNSVKEPNTEPETDEVQELERAKEPTAEPETDGEEQKSVKEPNAEPETEAQELEPAKEPTVDTKLTEEEDMSEEKRQENDRESHTSVPETGKVESEAEEDEQRVIKEMKEESDKAEVGTIPGSA